MSYVHERFQPVKGMPRILEYDIVHLYYVVQGERHESKAVF
jgi:hypothetical protein